jgi:hypothetical protein
LALSEADDRIEVTIGRQTRLYHAFITIAPAALDAPSTLTLYAGPLKDVAGFAVDPVSLDATRAATPSRLVLIDTCGTRMAARALSITSASARAGRPSSGRPQHAAAVALAAAADFDANGGTRMRPNHFQNTRSRERAGALTMTTTLRSGCYRVPRISGYRRRWSNGSGFNDCFPEGVAFSGRAFDRTVGTSSLFEY